MCKGVGGNSVHSSGWNHLTIDADVIFEPPVSKCNERPMIKISSFI